MLFKTIKACILSVLIGLSVTAGAISVSGCEHRGYGYSAGYYHHSPYYYRSSGYYPRYYNYKYKSYRRYRYYRYYPY